MSVTAEFFRAQVDLFETLSVPLVGLALSVAAVVPFYLVGYQTGGYPLIGLCLALGTGALVANFLTWLRLGRQSWSLSHPSVRRGLLIEPLLVGLLGGVGYFYGMGMLFESMSDGSAESLAWAWNSQVLFEKPVWHLGMGAVLGLLSGRTSFLVLPLQMRSGLSYGEAFDLVSNRIETIGYSPLSLGLIGLVLMALLVVLPILGILIPLFASAFCVRMYRKIFSTNCG